MDRVRHRFRTARSANQIRVSNDDQVVFGEFVTWARSHEDWRELLADLPGIVTEQAQTISSEAKFGTPRAYETPACGDALRSAYHRTQEELGRLERENAALHEEIEALRPQAAKLRQNAEQNRINAGRPRPRGKPRGT